MREPVGQKKSSNMGTGSGHGKAWDDELQGQMDKTHLSMHYRNLSPSPTDVEVVQLQHLCVRNLQPEVSQASSSASPCPLHLSLCLCSCACICVQI